MIDAYLPHYHYNEIHSKIINAPAAVIYTKLRHLNFHSSWISRVLFKLRGLSTKNMTFDRMVDNGSFFTMHEKENEEWIVGLLAESFKFAETLQHGKNFKEWNPGSGVKIAWNFKLNGLADNKVKVSTETRVQCLNRKTLLIFSVYWFFVRPFSGLIRLEMLRILKKECET